MLLSESILLPEGTGLLSPLELVEDEAPAAMPRRHFLKLATGALLLGGLSGLANPAFAALLDPQDRLAVHPKEFWERPRELWIQRQGHKSSEKITFWKDGDVDIEGYVRLCYLLKDMKANQAVRMDLQLFNLLYAIQGWLREWNVHVPFIVTSGYRSPMTNRNTEGASWNSMHLYGKAADVIMPGIPINYLGRLTMYFRAGGVGFYQRKNFVHIDTGRVRKWAG